jgi:ATP-dependent helicase HrpA
MEILQTDKESPRSKEHRRPFAARRVIMPRLLYPLELPILERKDEIIAALKKNPVIVVTGETGSGKTTQIPKFCIEAGRGRTGMIACTQPRRIAAIAVARRIAEEMGEEVGRSVGYKIRFDDHTPPGAAIKIMTDGVLLMETHRDPLLRRYDTIIVDEAHERSLNIDFVLGILKNILMKRDDLRVIITSATIDTEKFSEAFDKAPIIEVSGRVYPVQVRYSPPDRDSEEQGEGNYIEAAVQAVDELVRKKERGDILIFMPTEQDIRETCELLQGHLGEDAVILPLFSRLSRMEQQRVFQQTIQRRIVVATNVAETSLTIPGIRFVIDTGLARISIYNPRSRTAGLPVRPISKSSADQRQGRCGRVASGVCIRLYSEEEYLAKPLYTPPEILRANLAGVILRMLALGLGDISAFPFIDKPAPKSIKDGLETLQELKAVEHLMGPQGNGEPWHLTKMGKIMASLPIDPRIARIIIEAKKENCLREVIVIAAALTIQDPRERPLEKEKDADRAHTPYKDPASDFISLLKIYDHVYGAADGEKSQNRLRKLCRDNFLSWRRIREWRDIYSQLTTILTENKFLTPLETGEGADKISPDNKNGSPKNRLASENRSGAAVYMAIHRSILSGFLGHIAFKKEKNLYTATQGRQAMVFPGSGLFNHGGNWIVAAELIETSRLFARIVANIDSAWIEELAGDLCHHTYFAPHWEKKRGEVVATEQVTLFGLTIVAGRPVSYGKIDPAEASRIFIRGALVEGEVNSPLPFLVRNQALIKKISDMEEKIRRHDLLVGEEEIARFYEDRLPGIFDIRTLQRLVRDSGDDSFLLMKEEDLLVKEPDSHEIELYPDSVSAAGWKLECNYRFAPGKPEDGITLKIPVQSVSSVPAASLDWGVPGLLQEKIAALLRSLPKEYRKKLMPLTNTADIVLKEMPREGRLLSTLSRFLHDRFGVDIPASCWQLANVEERLNLRFSVVDAKGREVAAGRDLSLFERKFDDAEGDRALARARAAWEKTGLITWDFGDIPENIVIEEHGSKPFVLYPALEAAGDAASLRLFKSSQEANAIHLAGVKALFTLHFPKELRALHKSLSPSGELKMPAAAFGGTKSLENALYEKVLNDLFAVDIRTERAFYSHAQKVQPLILPKGEEIIKIAAPVIKALYEVTEKFRKLEAANGSNRPFLNFLTGLRNELDRLVPADFLIKYDEKRLAQIVRYLRALIIRAEKGAVHLEKALTRGGEIRALEDILRDLSAMPQPSAEEKLTALEELHWMIEEYKVSVFAQELKTPFPVSRKRLDARIEEIRRMV